MVPRISNTPHKPSNYWICLFMFGGNCGIYLILYWHILALYPHVRMVKPFQTTICWWFSPPIHLVPLSDPLRHVHRTKELCEAALDLDLPTAAWQGRRSFCVDSLLGFHRNFQPKIVYLNVYRNLP